MSKNVLIIGGGPAGMSTALWLKYLDFNPIILEKNNCLGGLQNLSHFKNVYYLGMANKTGFQIANNFQKQIMQENISYIVNCQIESIRQSDNEFMVKTQDLEFNARFITLATGQNIKQQETIKSIKGSQFLIKTNKVCFDPGQTPLLETKLSGKKVAVIGGGDNGLVTSIYLANTNIEEIHLLVRSEFCCFRVNQDHVAKLIDRGRIILHQPSNIQQFEIKNNKINIYLEDSDISVDFLCFRLGFQPNVKQINQLLQKGKVGQLELTKKGHIKTDQILHTSIKNIYAVGDLVNDRDPCVATAVASGAVVSRTIDEDYKKTLVYGKKI